MKQTPWSYRKGNSLLHRLPAGLKLGFLIFLSLTSFFPSLIVLSAVIFILLLLSIIAGIKPRELLRGSRPLFIIILGIFILQSIEISPPGFSTEGLSDSLFFCLRIAAAFSAGSLLFSVTTSTEIRKSLSRFETAIGLKNQKLSLGLSLMLSFLPRIFVIWEDLTLANKSRGGKGSLSMMKTLVPLLIEKMMSHAAEKALAMEARGKSG